MAKTRSFVFWLIAVLFFSDAAYCFTNIEPDFYLALGMTVCVVDVVLGLTFFVVGWLVLKDSKQKSS